MHQFFTKCAVILLVVFIVGCEKEDPNPELRDPIWKDLSERAASYEKQRDEARAKLKGLREKIEKIEPNTMDMKDIKRDLAKTEKALLGAEQLAKYYRVRTERRKVEDKIAARNAAAEGKEWPDKHEYSDYLVNKRVHEISLNWNTRVPKLQDRLVRKPAKEKPAASGH